MELTVRELVAAAQQARKAKLDAGRVDTVFKVGGRVLLRTKELLYDICKLWPRWDGPFTVTGAQAPTPTRLRSCGGCGAAQRSTSTCSTCSPSTSVSTLHRLRAQCRTRGTRASTRWTCCSTARRRWVLRATSYGGAGTHQRMTSGCGRRSWCTARRRWLSTTPQHRAGGGRPGWASRALALWSFLPLWPRDGPCGGPAGVPVGVLGRGSGWQGAQAGGAVDPVLVARTGPLGPGTGGPG
jgi:hypothetical protein